MGPQLDYEGITILHVKEGVTGKFYYKVFYEICRLPTISLRYVLYLDHGKMLGKQCRGGVLREHPA